MILFDSDILIDVSRRVPPAIAWFQEILAPQHGEAASELVVPGIVWLELIEGCRNKREIVRVSKLFQSIRIVWPDSSASDYAIALVKRFNLSHGLRKYDALVAVTALALDQPLHTFNVRHFRIVPGLKIVQPYSKQTRR